MQYTKLGNSGIEISRFCLGCMSFGDRASKMHAWTLNPEESEKIIRHALDLGVNFFDTANSYSAGTSEEYLGRAIKNNVARDKVVLASKVYFNEGHLSRQAINREIEGTLKRLGTDYLELGASAMFGYQFYDMQLAARDNGFTPFVSMQNHYNPLYREDERELIPVCKRMNVALTPYSPLAAGRCARPNWEADTLRSQTDKVAHGKYDSTEDTDKLIAARIKELAEKYGTSMTAVTFAWHFKKGVASPVVGATKEKYLDDAVKAFDVPLTDEDAAYIDELYLPHKIVGALWSGDNHVA